MPFKPILAAKRLLKGRPLTASELGYKRDKTGRLTRPGQEKFNEKIEFTKGEKEAFVKIYKQKIKNTNNPLSKDILEQKIQDRRNQYNNKLETIRDARKREIQAKEKTRLNDLKKRQLKDWIKKLNSVLKTSRKGTVQEIKEKLFQELFKQEIISIKASLADKGLQTMRYDYLHGLFTTDFYNLLHSSFIPTNLDKMSARDAIKFIEDISKKAKSRKSIIYKEFRKDYVI